MTKINKIFIAASASILLIIAVLFFIGRKQAAEIKTVSAPASQSSAPPASQTGTATTAPNQEPTVSVSSGTTLVLDDKLKNTSLPGKETADSSVLEKFGKYAFETLGKSPHIVDLIRAADKKFDPASMEVSSLSRTFRLNNGKNYLALFGCATGNCGGTEKIVLYNENEDKVYVAAENADQTQLFLFGDPGEQEKDLLIFLYFHK